MKKIARELRCGDVVFGYGKVTQTFIGYNNVTVWFKKKGVTRDVMFPLKHEVEMSETIVPAG